MPVRAEHAQVFVRFAQLVKKCDQSFNFVWIHALYYDTRQSARSKATSRRATKMNEPRTLGRVIVLNGPSSAGKSTLCKALQTTLDEYWWHMEMDTFTMMQPTWRVPEMWNPTPEERPHPSWDADTRLAGFLTGWYQCIRALALAGNNVLADAGFLKREWLHEQADALDGIDALYVGVYCPLDVVERREQARGDRQPGYSRSQYDLVHLHGPYDITVDTSVLGPQEVAEVIKAALGAPPVPSVFERLRARVRS